MNTYYKISGRYFIRTSVVSRVALPAYNTISVQAMNQLQDRTTTRQLFKKVVEYTPAEREE